MTTSSKWTPTQVQASHIENLFVQLETPTAGRAFIRNAIENAPCRPVNNIRGNVMFKYVSRKNDRTLELESRSGEYPQAVLLERDPDVVMWLCQAPKVSLDLKTKDGKRTGVTNYTLDFLVACKDKFAAIEVRDESALVDRQLKNPDQFWYDNDNDQWHYRAAEEHFAALGIEFSVIANRQINSTYVNNLNFLEDFLAKDVEPADTEVAERLKNRVQEAKMLSFEDALQEGFTADQLLLAIACNDVYVDLLNDRVEFSATLSMYASPAVREVYRAVEQQQRDPIQPIPGSMFLRAGARVEFGGRVFHVVLCGERDVLLREEGTGTSIPMDVAVLKNLYDAQKLKVDGLMPGVGPRELANCSERELDDALRRLNALRNRDTSVFSERSLSRFSERIRGIESEIGQILALVDDSARRGNRVPRYDERDEEMASKAIEEKFNRPEACTKGAAYEHYLRLCREADEANPEKPKYKRISFTTFCRRIDQQKSTLKRRGKRVAYQEGPIVTTVHDRYPVHGVFPHEICYIDHTVLNLATIAGDGSGMPLSKPYMSVAEDGCTTQARALILSYRPPSASTVMLVLRDYVRRHHRLPKILSLDNAKEFRGKALEAFCKLYGIQMRFRPPGQPRGGAPIESLQGAIEKEVISELTGNTIAMKDPRLVTKSVNGFNRAEHTLTSAYRLIEAYLFVERENRIHPTLGVSPAMREEALKETTGERTHIHISYDENLLLATSPYTTRMFHKVCPRRGVWVDNMWYRHAMLRGHKKGFKVRVRIEPFAARVVYVEVKNRWYAAVGHNSRDLDGRTGREVQIAVRHQRQTAGVNGTKATRSIDQIEGASRSLRPQDFDERLAKQEAENKHLLAANNMLGAMVPSHDELVGEQEFDFERGPAKPPELAGATVPLGFNQVYALINQAHSAIDAQVLVNASVGVPANSEQGEPSPNKHQGYF